MSNIIKFGVENQNNVIDILINSFHKDPGFNFIFENKDLIKGLGKSIPMIINQQTPNKHVLIQDDKIIGYMMWIFHDQKESLLKKLKNIFHGALFVKDFDSDTVNRLQLFLQFAEDEKKRLDKDKILYIYFDIIGIDILFQNKGYGKFLMEYYHNNIKEYKGYISCLYTSSEKNRIFYEKLGYKYDKEKAKVITFKDKSVNVYWMEKSMNVK